MAARKKGRKKGARARKSTKRGSSSTLASHGRRIKSLEGFRTKQEKHNKLVDVNIAHIYSATKISKPKAFSRLEHTGRKKRSRRKSS